MRLLHINYWAGHNKLDAAVLLIEMDGKGLKGLRSDRLLDSDITKIKKNSAIIGALIGDKLVDWLKENIVSFNSALVSYNAGRYNILKEHIIG